MKNKFYLFSLILFSIILAAGNCKKPKDPNPSGSLTIETNPPSGSNQAPAPGPDFPLVVTITSAMPSAGVKIDVVARAEGSITPFFSTSQNSSSASNNFLITGAPQGVTNVVDVTVTDLSNTTFTATSSFRFARK
jgi:hypothetical protein